jgi:hypothetical protein
MKHIFWTGYSNNERLASINAIRSIVSRFGDIVDYKLFSDISLTMTIEMEEAKMNTLYDDLKDIISMDAFEYIHSDSTNERTIYFSISFSKGTGNLKIEVPAVPG